MASRHVKREIRLHRDHQHLCRSVAEALLRRIRQCVEERGACYLALSGRSTPLPLFSLLADDYREDVPWASVHLFWADERYVNHSAETSNYGTAFRRLIRHVPIPGENVHPVPTGPTDPSLAADQYEHSLRSLLGPGGRLDIILLGLGVDGHTASLFPGSSALSEHVRWVVAVEGPVGPPQRVTMTFPLINAARRIYFLVVGRDKAKALRCALGQTESSEPCPALAVDPSDGDVTWWIDADAAEGL